MDKQIDFTATRIARLSCEDGKQQTIFKDLTERSLGLRVTAAGAKAYIFESRLNGRTVRTTIGDTDTWTIDKARREARRLKTLVDQNIDPRQEARDRATASEKRREAELADKQASAAAEAAARTTVGDAWATYIRFQQARMDQESLKRGRKWGARHLRDHLNLSQAGGEEKKRGKGRTRPGVLYPLMGKRLIDITAHVLKDWMDSETADRANNARQGFEAFRTFWRWCGEHPEYRVMVNLDAVSAREIRDAVPARKPKDGDCLQREQLAAWFESVRQLSPVVSAYLQALLLTGARREELAAVRWDDVDLRWNSLLIADKVEGERTIPLTPYVQSLLLDLKRRNDTPPPPERILHGKVVKVNLGAWKPSPWVFFSTREGTKTGRLTEPGSAHDRALRAAGLPKVTLHGLRRSFGTLAEWVEVPIGVVAQIQGHKPSAIAEKHYRRRPLDLLRQWHTRIEAWILAEAGIALPAEEDSSTTDSGNGSVTGVVQISAAKAAKHGSFQ